MPSLLSHGTSVKIVSSERLPNICLILTQSFGYWGLLFNLDFYWNGEIFSVQTIWLGLYSLQENCYVFLLLASTQGLQGPHRYILPVVTEVQCCLI